MQKSSFFLQQRRVLPKHQPTDQMDATIERLRAKLESQYEQAIATSEKLTSSFFNKSKTARQEITKIKTQSKNRANTTKSSETSFLSRFSKPKMISSPYQGSIRRMEKSIKRDDERKNDFSFYPSSYLLSTSVSLTKTLGKNHSKRFTSIDNSFENPKSPRKRSFSSKRSEETLNFEESEGSFDDTITKLHDEIEKSIKKHPQKSSFTVDSSVSEDLFDSSSSSSKEKKKNRVIKPVSPTVSFASLEETEEEEEIPKMVKRKKAEKKVVSPKISPVSFSVDENISIGSFEEEEEVKEIRDSQLEDQLLQMIHNRKELNQRVSNLSSLVNSKFEYFEEEEETESAESVHSTSYQEEEEKNEQDINKEEENNETKEQSETIGEEIIKQKTQKEVKSKEKVKKEPINQVNDNIPKTIKDLVEEEPEDLHINIREGLKPISVTEKEKRDLVPKIEKDPISSQASSLPNIASAEERKRLLQERIKADNALLKEMELFTKSIKTGCIEEEDLEEDEEIDSSEIEPEEESSDEKEYECDKDDNVTLKDEEEEESLSQIYVGNEEEEDKNLLQSEDSEPEKAQMQEKTTSELHDEEEESNIVHHKPLLSPTSSSFETSELGIKKESTSKIIPEESSRIESILDDGKEEEEENQTKQAQTIQAASPLGSELEFVEEEEDKSENVNEAIQRTLAIVERTLSCMEEEDEEEENASTQEKIEENNVIDALSSSDDFSFNSSQVKIDDDDIYSSEEESENDEAAEQKKISENEEYEEEDEYGQNLIGSTFPDPIFENQTKTSIRVLTKLADDTMNDIIQHVI